MMRRFILVGAALIVMAGVTCLPTSAQQTRSPGEQLAYLFDAGCMIKTDMRLVRRLLHQGASIRTRSNRGITVAMFAASCAGDLPLLKQALKGGVDVNARTLEGMTALHYVMNSRNEEKVKALLNAGAEVNARDEDRRTPLMMAAEFKFRGGINLLLAHGAEPDARNQKGHSALVYAAGHPGLVRLLRQAGAGE